MKKIATILIMLLISVLGFSQELQRVEQDAVNGDVPEPNAQYEYKNVQYDYSQKEMRMISYSKPLIKETAIKLEFDQLDYTLLSDENGVQTYRNCSRGITATVSHTNYDPQKIYVHITYFYGSMRTQAALLKYCKK